jgi:hypothetical protein
MSKVKEWTKVDINIIIFIRGVVMETYKPRQFSKLIGVCVKTLQRWDNSGKFKARRTPTNQRYYTEGDLKRYYEQSMYQV